MVTRGRGAGKGSSLQADSQKSKQVRFGVLRTPLAYFQCQVFFWLKSLALFSTCPVLAGHCQSPPAQSHQEHLCCSREQAGPGRTGRDWAGLGRRVGRRRAAQHREPCTAAELLLHRLYFCFVPLTTCRGRSSRWTVPILQRRRAGPRSDLWPHGFSTPNKGRRPMAGLPGSCQGACGMGTCQVQVGEW